MINAPFATNIIYSNRETVHVVVDVNMQVIAFVSPTLPLPCQETTAKVIAQALNQYIKPEQPNKRLRKA